MTLKPGLRFLSILMMFGCVAPEEEDPVAASSSLVAGDRYIVKFSDAAAGRAAIAAHGGSIALELDGLDAAAARLPAAAVTALRANPSIEYIEEDALRYPLAQSVPYGIPMVQADQVSDSLAANRKVCIIDSGYGSHHEDLQDTNVTASPNAGTGDPLVDECGHGSHVAGTIAALGNDVGVVGVLPSGNTSLHIVKVFSGEACDWTYTSTLVSALSACRSAGANVVSMSLGGATPSITEQNAFNDAWASGVLSVAAAGNDGNTAYSYPASYGSVVSVAAIDAAKVVADFSQKNDQVDLAAPGVAVDSTLPYVETNTVTANGTTFAGSHIEFSGRSAGVSGTLVDGGLCQSPASSWNGNVILCQRGTVTFNQKVQSVQSGGGVAAVIYNNAPGGFEGTLGDGNSSTIPGIGLSMEDGEALLAGALGAAATVVSQRSGGSSYAAWNGTSMATPHVSGVAALVWSHNPAWTNSQIRTALEASAQDLGPAGRDDSYGHGLVQAAAALAHLQSPGDTTAPVISNVASVKQKGGKFQITWTTNEAANSEVRFSGAGTFTDAALVTSHKMSFRGSRGVTYTYWVASTDAAGNRSEAGPFTHSN